MHSFPNAYHKGSSDRRGTAVVELAVCLPVLVLLVVGAIELTHVIYLKQSLAAAAYESVREAVRPEATLASTQAKAIQILTGHRVRNGSVRVTPSIALSRGQRLTVSVSAPINDNRLIIPRYVAGVTLTGSATMVKE
jgi:Flp pilus assembly protein TadG